MNPTKQKQAISTVACAPGALLGGPTRTRFFDGMFLTQADLENEQRFWRLKRRLTNRALGDGVVWGLKLAWNPSRRTFALSPGYALDCCGNDLVVECPVEISESELWSRSDPALRRPGYTFEPAPGTIQNAEMRDPIARPRSACVVLQYTECPEDARPVHRDACAGPTTVCEPSRVRESARLLLVPAPTRVPTPPEKFLDELEAWSKGLPASIRDAVFPPQALPHPTPATDLVPMHVKVAVPGTTTGTTPNTSDQQPLPTGSTTPVTLRASQTPDPKRRTGVVTFELTTDLGWGFTAGTVLDQARVVETVTPPTAPSMFWSFDVALDPSQTSATASFDFQVDKLVLAKMFGGNQGEIDLRITGTAIVTAPVGTTAIDVVVEELTITTVRADVTEDPGARGCFRDAVPWGWTIDPSNGRSIASTLVLAAMYGFLSEVVQRGASSTVQLVAARLYVVTWYALFGANPTADVAEEYRRKLAELILDLYRRWCEGLAYPGPRCTDEHHGVYLGCAELDRSGRIASFDLWANRRYVVTGALLDHWAQQFGVAPIDVVVGRFARAFCCVAGQTPIVMPRLVPKRVFPGVGGDNADERFHVGTRGSTETFAKLHGAEVRWVSNAELAARTPDALIRRDEPGGLVVLASAIESGGTIAIAIPVAGTTTANDDAIRENVNAMIRRGESRVREAGRAPVGDFAVGLFEAARPDAVLDPGAPTGTANLAKQLSDKGAHLADIVAGGSAGVRKWLGGSVADPASVADLVDRSELALDHAVLATVAVLGASVERASFGDVASQDKLAKAILEKALPRVERSVVVFAAKTAAKG